MHEITVYKIVGRSEEFNSLEELRHWCRNNLLTNDTIYVETLIKITKN